ncbi:MAG TPA: hypothetical protein VIH61_08335, partial [Waddliaceae bacterium]
PYSATTTAADQLGAQILNNGIPNTEGTIPSVSGTSTPAPARIKIDKKSEKTNRIGFICITTQTGGYVGAPSQRALLPPYLEKRRGSPVFTMENGDPLTLNSDDFFVEFHLYDASSSLRSTGIPSSFFLPAVLFADKKDEDSIILKYNNELIELTINQDHGLKFAQGTFKTVFASQKAYIEEQCDIKRPCFAKYDANWWYKIGEGAIYHLVDVNNNLILEKRDLTHFRSLKTPRTARMDVLSFKDHKNLLFCAEFPGFEPSDIDIIVNEKYLIFYAMKDTPLFDAQEEVVVDELGWKEEDAWRRLFGGDMESIVGFRLDHYQDLNVEKMKTMVSKGTVSLVKGVLTLKIPLD